MRSQNSASRAADEARGQRAVGLLRMVAMGGEPQSWIGGLGNTGM